jgi:ATP-dependent RNA helicase RhlB
MKVKKDASQSDLSAQERSSPLVDSTNAGSLKKPLLTRTAFSDLGLSLSIMKGIEEAGFTHCTPIQEQCLPHSLKGKDAAGQAQTGTGKTAAFLLTIFHRLEQLPPRHDIRPRALIIAPTRELVQQIYEECSVLGRYTGFTSVPILGGIDYTKQEKELREGKDIVVATPGRLIDYTKQKIFVGSNIKVLVIDEADRLFDMGFVKDLRYILRRLPPYTERQSMLFSATLGYRVMELTYEFMNLPVEIAIEPKMTTLDNIQESLYHVDKKTKFALLLGLLARNPWERTLIFCNTKSGVERLARKIGGKGYSVQGITGDLQQRKRLSIMKRFKEGRLSLLVATDVASRGIHVEDIDAVINYDLPQDPENYVHRIGRTGRVGKAGVAVSLADEEYVVNLEAIEHFIGKKIPMEWAEDDWFLEDRPVRPPKEPAGSEPKYARRGSKEGIDRRTSGSRKRRPRRRSVLPMG